MATASPASNATAGRTFGPWELDHFPPVPARSSATARTRAHESKRWLTARTYAEHRDYARAKRLAREHPEHAAAIRAEHEAMHAEHRPVYEAAEADFDRLSRILLRTDNPPDFGPAWCVPPVVADAIARTNDRRATLAGIPTRAVPRPRGAGRPAARTPRRVVSNPDDDDGPSSQAGVEAGDTTWSEVAPGHWRLEGRVVIAW